jgi:hypothetical protein
MWERTSPRREDMAKSKALIAKWAVDELERNLTRVGYDRAESAMFNLQDLGLEIPTRITDKELTKLLPDGVRTAILEASAQATALAKQAQALLDEAASIAERHVDKMYDAQEKERLKNHPKCETCHRPL